jgi:AcrR family transcriptional regulator
MSSVKHRQEPDTRSRILESARALLMKRQGANVSMEEIGRKAGVSRQAVYLHFADRGDLFVALVQYVDEKRGLADEVERLRNAPQGSQRCRQWLPCKRERTRKSGPWLEQLMLCDARIKRLSEHGRTGCGTGIQGVRQL